MSINAVKIQILTFFAVFLVLILKMQCHQPLVPSRASYPGCIAQFALVSPACAMLPDSALPPPLPALSPSDDDGDHEKRHRHGHKHKHKHKHVRQESPTEHNCCRWLREVDTQCVCDLLVRLPTFLVRLVHNYTVRVSDSCSVTFRCGGQFWV